CIDTASFTIGTNTGGCNLNLQVSTTDESNAGANDGTATITVTGGSTPYTILWSNGDAGNNADSLGAGNYYVIVQDSAGCLDTAFFNINVSGSGCNFTVTLSATDESLSGLNDGVASASAVGAINPISYLWSNGNTTALNQGLAPGWYSVDVSDSTGCTVTDSVFIDTGYVCTLSLTANGIDETAPGAGDGSANTNVLGGFPPYDYAWSNGQTTGTINNLSPGTYFITVTDSIGCQQFDVVNIGTAGCNMTVNVVVNHETGVNTTDGSINLFPINGANPYSFNWSNGETIQFIDSLSPGVYTYTVTDSLGCTLSDSVVINAGTCGLQLSGAATHETTAGANDGTATAIAFNGAQPYTYVWSTGASSNTINNLSPGTYSVTVTDNNGCVLSTVIVVNPSNCNISATATSTPESGAGNADGNLSASVTGGSSPFTYSWNNGSTTQNVTGVPGGNYTVIVTDANGCMASASTTVTTCNLQLTTSSTDETSTGANDGTANVNVTGGTQPYSYLWINAGTTASIDSLAPGIYTIVVTDANGCVATDSVQINPNASSIYELDNETIAIFPNPASSIVNIKSSMNTSTIELLDMLGKVVLVENNTHKSDVIQLNIEGLSNGSYFVKVIGEKGTSLKKLIIQ
ncbi:MAG: T9SS type A sorting domain-containing protein, partial [Flavobacteriales bacterium]|nr:T9SS type A sorting domain-containing protein [Flavobacteriales bacterium]